MIDFKTLVDGPVLDQFAETVTIERTRSAPGTPAVPARGIFDADHDLIMTEVAGSKNDAAGHSTTAPVLAVSTHELGFEPVQGDTVVIGASRYRVFDVHPDGDSWVDLVLRKVSS